MRRLRIVFMGSPDFAVPSLEKLVSAGNHDIVSVVSGTDKKRGRGSALSPTPVKAKALELGFSVIEADSMKDPSLHAKLAELNPDLFVVVAFKILPSEMLAIPALGSVNLHASLLPKYRGAAPIHHAVMRGETDTGCTIFKLDAGVDTGGIILQHSLEIGPDETTGSVYTRLMKAGSEALNEAVNRIADGSASYSKQDDSKATPAPKLFDEHCVVDFSRPAPEVHNQIRGLSPFPTAYTLLDGKKLKLMSSSLISEDEKHDHFGKVIESDDGDSVMISCNPGTIVLGDVRYEGKKQMPATDFFRGYQGERVLNFDL
ncbi:MAG: methionyl-tRNA formyltransferase [Balneolia bacterium]|nr:methionyl-tRNA formyltransferase [Balneolia bacterium]